MTAPFIRRVRLSNYKSIAACDVTLHGLTFLVGPNGSGKSNFLDALRFVADGLITPLEHAIRERGGIGDVRRRSTGHPHNFGIRLEMTLPESGHHAMFAFEITSQKNSCEVKEERCVIRGGGPPLIEQGEASYVVRCGEVVQCSLEHPPAAAPNRLYLVSVSGAPAFKAVYEALSSMSFYNLSPNMIREVQTPDAGSRLLRDGSNLASVLGRLTSDAPHAAQRAKDYLAKLAPGVENVRRVAVANKETLEFKQTVKGAKHPWKFFAGSMSDGTLRALGVLIALAQAADPTHFAALVGIEEPESAVHPAATGILLDALLDAAQQTQVMVTSHSPDLLESEEISHEQIIAVSAEEGVSVLGPVNAAGRAALRERLYTAGELLRMSQLEPDEEVRAIGADPLDLFEDLCGSPSAWGRGDRIGRGSTKPSSQPRWI